MLTRFTKPNLKCDSNIITNSFDVSSGQTRSFYEEWKIPNSNSIFILFAQFSLLVVSVALLSPWPAPLNGVTEKVYT